MSTEPWLSGSRADLQPVPAALLYCFDHALLDIQKWTDGLSTEQVWTAPGEVGSIGFHLRHIAGSVDRLMTYARGEQLDDQQLTALKNEGAPGATRTELIDVMRSVFESAGRTLQRVDVSTLTQIREIGRKRVPVPLGVLLVHIAEHTQRHVGEVIVTAKLVRGGAR
ncbi:MAG TPA: DinB family protein [Bryobacteraceae bacterium]|nr:DinB family protein [Bryobacteraceae bacterium]